MQTKSLRKTLIATTCTSGFLTLGVLGWVLMGAPKATDHGQPIEPVNNYNPTLSKPHGHQAKDFGGLANAILQGPRNIQPKQPKDMTKEAMNHQNDQPSFGIQLVGTMIEPRQSLALFRDATGAFDVKGQGQVLELSPSGVKIEGIAPGSVGVLFDGKKIQLELLAVNTNGDADNEPIDENNENGNQANTETLRPTLMEPYDPTTGLTPLPEGEEDIFAPLPANMDPTRDPSSYAMPGAANGRVEGASE